MANLVSCALDIAPCLDSELTEFPLRMRDWLKNVLVTLYERDEGNNLLTEKQKLRVSGLLQAWTGVPAIDFPADGDLGLISRTRSQGLCLTLLGAFTLDTRTQTSS